MSHPALQPVEALKAIIGHNDSMTNVVASKSDNSNTGTLIAMPTPYISTLSAGQGNSSSSICSEGTI